MTVSMVISDGQLRIAFVINNRAFKEMRAKSTESWTEELIRRTTREMAQHLRSHRDAVGRYSRSRFAILRGTGMRRTK